MEVHFCFALTCRLPGCDTRIRGPAELKEYTLPKRLNCLTKQDHIILTRHGIIVFGTNSVSIEALFSQMPIELPQWLQRLRRSEIVDRVLYDPRSTGSTPLGVDREVVVREVIGGGQAEFDQPWNDLSADDRVLLYAYFNQLGHLEELAEAFRMLFSDASGPDNPIVVDLGCGPFTGGLAIATGLGHESRFDYIGVDRSRAMRELGEKLASAAAELDRTPRIDRHWSPDISSVTWDSAPGWRPVFVIVSYLLASPTLDVGELVRELERLLTKLGRGPVTVLYTNSPRPEPNRGYPSFRTALLDAGFDLFVEDTGSIEIERWAGSGNRRLRYALFHRPNQDILRLGEE